MPRSTQKEFKGRRCERRCGEWVARIHTTTYLMSSASGAGGDDQRGAGSEERARDRQERRALVFGRKQDELVHA